MDALSLEEKVFRRHLDGGRFQSGLDRGNWRLVSVEWPYAVIAVRATPRSKSPDEYTFRFDLTNYPQDPPTARLWDAEAGTPLPRRLWPTGAPRFAMAFNPDWVGGQALYLPCDRLSIPGHDAWRTQHPHMTWTPSSDITLYLNILHEYMHSRDYQGVLAA